MLRASDQVDQNEQKSTDFCAFLSIQDLAKRHKIESNCSFIYLLIIFLMWILELDRSAFY